MDIEDTTLLSVGAHNKVTVFIGSHLDGRRSAGAHARRAGKGTSTSTTSAGINNSTNTSWNQEKQTMEETDELLGFYY